MTRVATDTLQQLAAKARENEEQAKHLEHDIRRDLCALDDCAERGERRDGRSDVMGAAAVVSDVMGAAAVAYACET